ncbi:hypothetical protein LINPERPRIM_LOCUS31810, partial [Linum perenne]
MDVPGSSSQVNQPSSALPFDLNNLPSDHSLDDDVISDLDENAISTQKQQEIVRGYGEKRQRSLSYQRRGEIEGLPASTTYLGGAMERTRA